MRSDLIIMRNEDWNDEPSPELLHRKMYESEVYNNKLGFDPWIYISNSRSITRANNHPDRIVDDERQRRARRVAELAEVIELSEPKEIIEVFLGSQDEMRQRMIGEIREKDNADQSIPENKLRQSVSKKKPEIVDIHAEVSMLSYNTLLLHAAKSGEFWPVIHMLTHAQDAGLAKSFLSNFDNKDGVDPRATQLFTSDFTLSMTKPRMERDKAIVERKATSAWRALKIGHDHLSGNASQQASGEILECIVQIANGRDQFETMLFHEVAVFERSEPSKVISDLEGSVIDFQARLAVRSALALGPK